MLRRPTTELYSELQRAYDHFNMRLFGGTLYPVMLTLNRRPRTKGYYIEDRFVDSKSENRVHEICLNPQYFAIQSVMQTLSTLVHEMVHQWQIEQGKTGKKGYHDTQWGERMLEIGLCPSDTAEPGGDRTGEKMSHYIIEGGAFHKACNELLSKDFILSWIDRYPADTPKGTLPLYPDPAEVEERMNPIRAELKAQGLNKE